VIDIDISYNNSYFLINVHAQIIIFFFNNVIKSLA